MALKPCRECGAQVSDKATSCPKCGSPVPKGTSTGTLIIGAFIILVVARMVWPSGESSASASSTGVPAAATAPSKTPEQLAETARKDREINIVLAGAKRLRDSMKKPETFKLNKAIMIDGKVICYEYTARNSWNDQASEHYVISDTVSTNGAKEWNKLCAGKSGDDYTSVRAVMNW